MMNWLLLWDAAFAARVAVVAGMGCCSGVLLLWDAAFAARVAVVGCCSDVLDVVTTALRDSFASIDNEFLALAKRDKLDDGSTSLVTMVVGNSPETAHIVVANAGDCRVVLCRGGKDVKKLLACTDTLVCV